MQQVGLAATEFGPDGFLPADPAAMAALLASRHLTAVGGFTPVVLHEPGHDPAPGIERLLDSYDAAHAGVLVLSAATGRDGYDTRPDLDEAGWQTLLANLDRLTALAAARGVRAVLHPHVGTMVERGDEVQRVLEGSAISLCLDTGHLLIGGTDPAELTRQAPDRIAHTHFKDVNDQIAAQVRSGRLTYTEGVSRGMYRPLGRGDVDFAAIVSHLRGRDYDGWYVLEQDTILTEEPRGEGPVADVRQSADLPARAADGRRDMSEPQGRGAVEASGRHGLRDRVVLISGGTAGLGAGIARAAAREGATVAVTGRRRKPGEALAAELTAGGTKALFVQADVADVAQVRACTATVIAEFGRVDSLVNAAGLTARGTLLDTTPDLFDAHIAVNLKAPFFLMQAVVADLVARKAPGTIVNIISTSAHAGQPYLAPYVAAKAGLAGLTRNAAHAHRWDRIRINGLNIGWTDTEGEDATQRRFHGADDDWRAKAGASLPMGKLGQVDEIADFVVFLLSDRSGVVTGSVIDWDQNVLGGMD